MPELPEVEGFRRFLARRAGGQRILGVKVLDPGVLRNVTPARLRSSLIGHRFRTPRWHGKWLVASTDGPILLLHFGMTGELAWAVDARDRHPHDRVVFELGRGELRYRDRRKVQGIWFARDEEDVRHVIGRQGADALDESVRLGGVPAPRAWLSGVRDDKHPACPRCHTRLTRTRVGGRSSHWPR